MIDLSQAVVRMAYTHFVGNPSLEEGHTVSRGVVPINEDMELVMASYFLSNFSTERQFHFRTLGPDGDPSSWISVLNQIFDDSAHFHGSQTRFVDALHRVSDHPKIPRGYLHVALLDQILIGDEVVQALGLFKSEQLESFIHFDQQEGRYIWKVESGYPLTKLDKGCLILNVDAEDGYVALVLDRKKPGEVADFWLKDFLELTELENEYAQTSRLIHMAKDFVQTEARQKHGLTRPDEIEYLNRSQAYFKGNDQYDTQEYVDMVFSDPEIAESFTLYKENQRLKNGEPIPDHFDISAEALKRQGKVFKSILKLDKNFHVYIHGDRSKIERGRDADGRKFYKIYFDREE